MKILDQARLWFREGNSDKVYEVDLVEVVDGQYVVNFRYGRRGAQLRDGTKTPLPVSLDKARAVYAALVSEKQRGGYRATEPGEGGAPPPIAAGAKPATVEARRARLLEMLTRGHRAEERLHHVVRKVGDLALREAEPMLLELLQSSPPPANMKPEVWRLLLVSALSRCGTSSSVARLTPIAHDGKSPAYVRDAARLALARIEPARAQELARSLYTPALPQGPGDDVQASARLLEAMLVDDSRKARDAIIGLYLLGREHAEARGVVLAIARVARLTRDEMGLLRSLYRMSELERDGELFAILARRFETLRAEPPRDTPTLRYFRRRVARFLRRLGAMRSPDYAQMATELLLMYRDSDGEAVRQSGWGTWAAFARYHAFNFVLFANSPRYQRASHHRATWRLLRKYRNDNKTPSVHEQAFPRLWDDAPESLWRLGESRAAEPVIEFATKALREQTQFLAQRSGAQLAQSMATAHPLMRRVAFDAARSRTPDVELARGALLSGIAEADDWVLAWIQRDVPAAMKNAELLALLATAPSAKVRQELERIGATLDPAVTRLALPQAIAILLGLPDEPAAGERAAGAVAAILRVLSASLVDIDVQVARDLLAHPLASVAELGGELVVRRSRVGVLPSGLLEA
jgi:hypothetical protein